MIRLIFFLFIGISFFTSCNSEQKQQNETVQEKVELPAQKINWVWDDEFSEDEKTKLTEWIEFTSSCAQEVLGRYPFDLNYHFHRRENPYQAVVFGHTGRTATYHGAHFYVDPTYSLEDLLVDWIAPHEISHLALPRLGKDNMWFYEGFATYMSRQVMKEMETITDFEADSTCCERIAYIKPAYQSSSNFIAVADSLKNESRYPQLYWGGASYFYTIEKQLQEANKKPLIDVLKVFQTCCHVAEMTLDDVVESFDNISGTHLFSELLVDYQTKPAYLMLEEY